VLFLNNTISGKAFLKNFGANTSLTGLKNGYLLSWGGALPTNFKYATFGYQFG
jgi:hypothetical protein